MAKMPDGIDFILPKREGCRICGRTMLRLPQGPKVPGRPWEPILDACFGRRPWVRFCGVCDRATEDDEIVRPLP